MSAITPEWLLAHGWHRDSDDPDTWRCNVDLREPRNTEGPGLSFEEAVDAALTEAGDSGVMPKAADDGLLAGRTASASVSAVLSDAPARFGLRAQGHLPTIERMLGEGASWDEIGKAIGWHGPTAQEYYERESVSAVPPLAVSAEARAVRLLTVMDSARGWTNDESREASGLLRWFMARVAEAEQAAGAEAQLADESQRWARELREENAALLARVVEAERELEELRRERDYHLAAFDAAAQAIQESQG